MYRIVHIQCEDDTLIQAVSPSELAVHKGDSCVVDCSRLLEFGRVVAMTDHEGAIPSRGAGPVVLRRATLQDHARARENSLAVRFAEKSVRRRVDERKLPIHIVRVRYSFDRMVLHVGFTSEEHVSVGEMVQALSAELRVRIEMRGMGVRDAASLAGGMGVCGRPLCCRTWLKEFDAVSVKMAKLQHLAINPGAISGMCGRLKCCLKYEVANYQNRASVKGDEKHEPSKSCCCGIDRD